MECPTVSSVCLKSVWIAGDAHVVRSADPFVLPLFLRTPLMLAVLSGHTDCVYSLLNKGASVEAKDKWGRTALHRGVNQLIHSVYTHTHCDDR